MAKGKTREIKATVQKDSETIAEYAQRAGAAKKEIPDVYRLADGRLKMVGAKHTERVGMVIPKALNDAWLAATSDRMNKTDIFEDAMLHWLGEHGWKLGDLDETGPEAEG